MYSPEFMRFLVGRDVKDYCATEKENKSENKSDGNKNFRYTKFATIPIEIKE